MASFLKDIQSNNVCVRRDAERAFEKVQARFGFTIVDGVMRWDSNDRVPPAEWVELAEFIFKDEIDIDACNDARDSDLAGFLATYAQTQVARTAEQITEEHAMAQAAMGPGVEMVNVITGEKFKT